MEIAEALGINQITVRHISNKAAYDTDRDLGTTKVNLIDRNTINEIETFLKQLIKVD